MPIVVVTLMWFLVFVSCSCVCCIFVVAAVFVKLHQYVDVVHVVIFHVNVVHIVVVLFVVVAYLLL